VSRIADVPFREEIHQAVLDLGHEPRCNGSRPDPPQPGESARPIRPGPTRLVILADLSSLAPAYERSGWAAWRECFPSMSPMLIAFVRYRDDPKWGHLLDRLMLSSACRLWLYKVGVHSVNRDLHTCLTEFTSHLDPEAVLDVIYSPTDRTVRIDFADGARRMLPWSDLQLPILRPALRPETIRVGENPELIEILDGDGEVYDIATPRLRALAGPAVVGASSIPLRGSRPTAARNL
jgi:hypothetical protein